MDNIKKISIILILMCTIFVNSNAQTPYNGIEFQAVAKDINNNPASNRKVFVKTSIIENSKNGTVVYVETKDALTTVEGVFSIIIGQGNRVSGVASLYNLDWLSKIYFVNIKIAIEPSMPDPSWTADNNYYDVGTSQFQSVPYSFSSLSSKFSDSTGTITTILPGSKGGTGIDNQGKTITLANNIITKGVGDLTMTTTSSSNVTFPTTGTLVNTKNVADIIGQDTISLSNRINKKINIDDTAAMLSNYSIAFKSLQNTKIDKLDAIIQNSLTVNGNSKMSDSLSVMGSAIIDSNLTVGKNLVVGGKLLLNYGLEFNDSLSVLRGARIDSSLLLKGKLLLNDSLVANTSANIKGNVKFDSTLYVNGRTTIQDSLIVKNINILSKIKNDSTTLAANVISEKNRATTVENSLATRLEIAENRASTDWDLFITRLTYDSTILAQKATSDSTLITARIANDTLLLSSRIRVLEGKSNRDSTLFINRLVNDSTILAGRITTEVTRATNAETGLATRIGLAETKSISDSTLFVNRLVNDSTILAGRITTETTRATNAETGLATRVGLAETKSISDSTLFVNRLVNDSTILAGRITTETTRATNAETGLATRIGVAETKSISDSTLFVNRLVNDSTILAGRITTETTRATNAETSLATRVGLAETKSISDSTILAGRITTEVTRATNAETGLATRIGVAETKSNSDSTLFVNRLVNDSTILAGRITTEVTRATNAETGLATRIGLAETKSNSDSTLFVNRLVNDSTILAGRITTETTRATNAENALATRIGVAETKSISDSTLFVNRLVNDSTILAGRITTETTRATNAETGLATRIGVAETKSISDSTLFVNRLVNDSTILAGRITTETTRATNAETGLATRIGVAETKSISDSTLFVNRLVNDSTILAGRITTETTRATNAETGLATRIGVAETKSISDSTLFVNRLVNDSTILAGRITTETSRATNAENSLATSITTETTRATNAETILNTRITSSTSSLTTDLTNEKNRALAAELILTNNIASNSASITAETTRATAAEAVLTDKVNTNTTDIETHTANINSNTINIGANATDIALVKASILSKVGYIDIPTFLAPYLKIDDFITFTDNYNAAALETNNKVAALITDTAKLITRFGYKENLSNKSTDINADANSNIKYPSVNAVKLFVDSVVTAAATVDASTTVKGKIRLAGDLTGIAASPTVNTVGGSSATDIHTAELLANASTSINTVNTIVKRDANGDFSARNITANLLGNSTNVSGIVLGANGGTGVDNTGKTITLGGNIIVGKNFTTTGTSGTASDITLKTTNTTSVTLPTSGVLATLAETEALTNKTINGLTLTSNATGFSIAGGNSSKSLTLSNNATIAGTNTGDQTILLTGDVTGTGTGTFSTTLVNSGVVTGVYGGATTVPIITIDAKGRITEASNVPIAGVSPVGSLLESGKIIIGDFSNQAAKVDMSGDVNINNSGVTTIQNGRITTNMVADANISYAKIQNVSASNKLLGRVSTGAGPIEEIATTGTGNVVRAVSPIFTGIPTVPTATYPSNDSTIANTRYVTNAISRISASSVSGIITSANGGTGVDNGEKLITLGGNFTTTGTTSSNASDITFKTSGLTNLTLPRNGTLATLSDVTGSSIGGDQISGIISPLNGGTGYGNDNDKIIVLGGSITTGANFTTSGTTALNASDITFKTTAATNLVLPTTGTIATLAGVETFASKTIDAGSNTITNITNDNIAATAAIADSKLATISTTGKVSNAATTATAANTANAIVTRDVNGAFVAGTITATLNGNAATATSATSAASATKLANARTIFGNSFDGTANLTNIIASSYGGTGNGFTKFSGPITAEKTFILPDTSATILTTNALVTTDQGGTGVSKVTPNYIFAGPATGATDGAPTFRAIVAADLPTGSASYINNATTQQASSSFNISGSGVIGTSLTAGSLNLTNALTVANGGTGANTLESNAVLLGNGTASVQSVAPGASGNVLVSNGTTWTSGAAAASGVSVVGTISTTSNSKGATISGTTLTLAPADGTNGGIVTTAAQTFAGTKTFSDVNLSGAIIGSSTAGSTLAGFNAAITNVTASITISLANAATYNGKVLVCSGSAVTITFDNTVPVGFSCMILQSDNNTVEFSGTNNRYNYTSTSGIYAIATAICYTSGSVLLTGDLQ